MVHATLEVRAAAQESGARTPTIAWTIRRTIDDQGLTLRQDHWRGATALLHPVFGITVPTFPMSPFQRSQCHLPTFAMSLAPTPIGGARSAVLGSRVSDAGSQGSAAVP